MAQAFGADEACHAEWTGTPVVVSMTNSSAASTQLGVGIYYITSDANCWFRQGASNVTAVASTSFYLPAGMCKMVKVSDATASGYIAAITTSTGKLYIEQPL